MDRRKQIILLSIFAAIAGSFLLFELKPHRPAVVAAPAQRTTGMVSE